MFVSSHGKNRHHLSEPVDFRWADPSVHEKRIFARLLQPWIYGTTMFQKEELSGLLIGIIHSKILALFRFQIWDPKFA
jgi:hypothetical protein